MEQWRVSRFYFPQFILLIYPFPVIVIFCTVTSATYWKNGRAYSAFLAYCVAILGSILVNALPSHDRVGLLELADLYQRPDHV